MIRVAGRELHLERHGRGEPLLLIQGMSGHSAHWGGGLLQVLTQHFDVLVLDHRGTGRSGPAGEGFQIADLATDAAGALDEVGSGPVHIFGVSMGGMVALELALARPELVRTLTLGATMAGGAGAVRSGPDVMQAMAEAMFGDDPEIALRTGYELNLSPGFRQDPGRWEPWREVAAQGPVPREVKLRFLHAIAAFDTADRVQAIVAPTLVLHGTADRPVDVRNGEILAAAIRGAHLERFDGAGHLFFWEQPERTARLVREHAFGARPRAMAHG
jgi:pimeloyl-ACP methyl ester carboxylesterase